MVFKKQAEDDFLVRVIASPEMDAVVTKCADIYGGSPPWTADEKDGVKTINFAKSICSEIARLTTLAIGIRVEGSARADWIQQQTEGMYFQIRHWVEYGCAYGTVFIKPNGKGFDVFTPQDVLITDCDNRDINGIIFKDSYVDGDKYYTRLEYHRFVETEADGRTFCPYYISNRAYVSDSPNDLGRKTDLGKTKWAGLMPDTPPIIKGSGGKLDGPLFGVFRTPGANNIDISLPLGLPVFYDAVEELRDLDVAYSRNAGEIFDSEKIILADDRLMFDSGENLKKRGAGLSSPKLPHYVRNVYGDGPEQFYQEINPQLNTDARLAGINSLLSQIGYKVGFSNGYFVFNEKSGVATATQIESEQQRTIQLVKDMRDKLECCLDGAICAMNIYADLYALAPVGAYEVTYSFGDITYSYEEDKQNWWKYVVQNKVPAWLYFVKFENMTEEEAKALVKEAQPEEPRLFGEE